MKRSFRLGLMGLAVLAGSAFGVTRFDGTASAQVPAGTTKTCTSAAPAAGATFTCTVTLGGAAASPFVITVTGATPTAATVGGTAPAGSTATTAPTATGGTITVNCGAAPATCPAGTVVTETLQATGAPGTTVVETLTPAGGTAAVLSPATPVVIGGAAGTPFVTTAGTALPAGFTKVCTTAGGTAVTTPAPGSTFTCTISVPANVASPITVNVTGATVTVAAINPATAGTVTAATGTSFTITGGTAAAPVAAGTAFPSAFTITETLTVTGTLGSSITQTVSTGNGVAVALTPVGGTPVVTAAGAAFTTTINLAGCFTGGTTTTVTGPTTTGGAFGLPTGSTTTSTVTPGTSISCVIDLNDNETGTTTPTGGTATASGNLVSSGIVAVTTTATTGQGTLATVTPNVGGIISQTGNTTTVRCGAAPSGANNVNSCDFIVVTFNATQTGITAGLPFPVTINVTYTPDIPAQNTSAQGQFTPFTIALGVAAFVQPTGLIFTCPSTLNTGLAANTGLGSAFQTVTAGLPGSIGGVNVAGVGILPSALICQVIPTVGGVAPGTGTVVGVAPGTFEISSLNGTLLDANGNITTNLRIACGGTTTNALISGTGTSTTVSSALNVNTCTGVNFAVLGLGVGFVEIRARYEPTVTAAAAGIVEVEGASSVGFIAPAVQPSLALNPTTVTAFNAGGTVVASADPSGLTAVAGAPCIIAAAGATAPAVTSCSTATVTFLGSVFAFNGNLFVNPTTGSFIRNPNGSVLNGNVVFSSSDDSVARFVTPGTQAGTFTVGGAASTVGSSTGSQIVVRCGTPLNASTGSGPGTGANFGSFFGGCTTASATVQGINPGAANITATFIADLPGAFGTFGGNIAGNPSSSPVIGANVFALINQFQSFGGSTGNVSSSATLTVLAPAAATTQTIALVRGCNNVSPTVTESATAFAARVTASSALVSIFEYQPATNTFRGFSPAPGAPSDLATVTRLRPVFVCVNAAATLSQPAL